MSGTIEVDTMEIKFVKLSPTQNMTVLAEDIVPRERHREVAERLMAYDGVFGEQVGFVEKPRNPAAWARLQMMGGEFCGNASMALAALLAWDRGLSAGQRVEALLEVSGAEDLLSVDVLLKDGAAACAVEMPLPESIEELTLSLDGQDCQVAVV
ncbi:MAG: diaminopimelate epimerase, partial [Candidatus Adiutrix sp.]|nr:diaminopimelate epimerase [Candidatus Adiutrix sp.]